jgi:hypothetical protein
MSTWRNANNRGRRPIQYNCVSYQIRIRGKPTSPQPLTNHGHTGGAGFLFIRTKYSSREWFDPEHVSQRRTNSVGSQLFRIAVATDRDRAEGHSCELLECLSLLAPGKKVQRRGSEHRQVQLFVLLGDLHDPLRLGIWERPDHYGIHHGEDRRIGRNRDRYGEDDGRRKHRCPPNHSHGKPDVTRQRSVQHSSSSHFEIRIVATLL